MRVRVPVVLGATVAIAAIVHAALALRSLAPWIVPDELIYSEIAKSLADGGLPKVRGDVTFEWGLGYPGLLAPIWAVVDDVERAYAVAKIWNALILASTAIPAYFLARRFTSEGYALVAAALTVSIPPLLYAGTLMTEVALYPAFVLAVWAITRAVEAPSSRTQLGALGAIGLACIVKSLSSVLIAALVAAIVLYHALDRGRAGESFSNRLRPYLVTWVGDRRECGRRRRGAADRRQSTAGRARDVCQRARAHAAERGAALDRAPSRRARPRTRGHPACGCGDRDRSGCPSRRCAAGEAVRRRLRSGRDPVARRRRRVRLGPVPRVLRLSGERGPPSGAKHVHARAAVLRRARHVATGSPRKPGGGRWSNGRRRRIAGADPSRRLRSQRALPGARARSVGREPRRDLLARGRALRDASCSASSSSPRPGSAPRPGS